MRPVHVTARRIARRIQLRAVAQGLTEKRDAAALLD
jgi:hypothetical protein